MDDCGQPRRNKLNDYGVGLDVSGFCRILVRRTPSPPILFKIRRQDKFLGVTVTLHPPFLGYSLPRTLPFVRL
jgi:hypothetical protein